jgi:hypothetical protein
MWVLGARQTLVKVGAMLSRGVTPVAWLMVGLTTVTIGLLTALTQAKWPGPLLVGVGTCAFAGFMIWRWRTHQLVDGEIEEGRAVHVGRFIAAVLYEALLTVIFVSYVRMVGPSPCWCADGHRFHTWTQLVAGGFLYLWFEIGGVNWIVMMVYRALHGRRAS